MVRGVILDLDGTLFQSVYDWPAIRRRLGASDPALTILEHLQALPPDERRGRRAPRGRMGAATSPPKRWKNCVLLPEFTIVTTASSPTTWNMPIPLAIRFGLISFQQADEQPLPSSVFPSSHSSPPTSGRM